LFAYFFFVQYLRFNRCEGLGTAHRRHPTHLDGQSRARRYHIESEGAAKSSLEGIQGYASLPFFYSSFDFVEGLVKKDDAAHNASWLLSNPADLDFANKCKDAPPVCPKCSLFKQVFSPLEKRVLPDVKHGSKEAEEARKKLADCLKGAKGACLDFAIYAFKFYDLCSQIRLLPS
jgi:hypothetical protein